MDTREHYTIAPDVMDQALNGDLGALGYMVDQLGGGPVLNMNAVDYVLQKVGRSNQALIARALLRWMARIGIQAMSISSKLSHTNREG